MIRIALVEDDAAYRKEFTDYLRRYEEENNVQFKITPFTDGDTIVNGYRAEFDIILMDIEMAFMDGMSAAEEIRKVDHETVIIFITNLSQYAMRGYAVEALDYVLKPVNYFAFSERIHRAITRMSNRRRNFISVPIKSGIVKIEVSRILYVEVRNHDLLYHTKDESILSHGTLAAAETLLNSSRFFRASKCYLINLEHVDSIRATDVFIDGEQIPFSRARKKPLLDALNNYLNEVSK